MKLPPKSPVVPSRRDLKNNLDALSQKLGPIELRSIASLSNYARNPRKHPESQLVALAASMRQFGFTMPVLVDANGEVIAGEARPVAAARVGLTKVPVLVAHHWSAAQVKAYRLADNRLAECATWDFGLLAAEILDVISIDEVAIEILGWETAEIDVILEEARVVEAQQGGAADPADAQVLLPPETVSRDGDVWLPGKNRLLCGSSLEESCWMRLMNGRRASMSFNDPPYNVSIAGNVCGLGQVQHAEFRMASGEMSRVEFVSFLTTFLTRVSAHCHDGAVIDVCIDWRHLSELHEALAAAGLAILNVCVWNKSNGGMGSLYRSKYELVFIARKGNASHRNNVQLGRHGRYRTNVWDYAGVNSFGANRMKDLTDHPTVKPVALVADAIRDVTAHGDIVIDAFMGVGTTILAAQRTGRIGYGIEIEPRFVDVAIRRWETLTGEQAILEDTGETFAEVGARRAEHAAEEQEEGQDEQAGDEPFDEPA